MHLRTPLSQARGLGSAKEGVEHWWMQRVTAVANVPLTLWFVFSVVSLSGAGYPETAAWIKNPVNTVFAVLMMANLFYHMSLGLQVVIEDYVHMKPVKLVALLTVRFGTALLSILAIVSILRVAFSS